ncbi:MAG: galactonate dehydratase [Candidatus Acetothermia bacterium]|nr:galactonate dehydratase [Candidatus Bipolaricaulota bacterium]
MDSVEKYDLYSIPPRWLLLKIETAEGLIGWGEPILEGRTKTTAGAVEELMEGYVLGKNPERIQDIWELLYRGGFYRGGPILMSALSGIDQALWDIKGKRYGVPVYNLLGGPVRDKIKIYSWIGGDTPDQVVQGAINRVSEGFKSLKMNVAGKMERIETPLKVREIARRFREVREAVGPDVDLAIDFHGRVSKSMFVRIAEKLEEYQPMFIEEPIINSHPRELGELKSKIQTPIALGERLYTRLDFRPYLEERAVDILQPDLSHAGGITECVKIASMADAYDVDMAFHCPLGPVALAACLQVDAVSHNALIQEQSLGLHYNEGFTLTDYVVNAEVLTGENGYLSLPEGPGLGIELDESALAEVEGMGREWKNPVWRSEDGSLAEW